MRRLVCVFLTCAFLLVGTIFTDTAMAENWKEKGLPPGIAKKINFDSDFNQFGPMCFGFKVTRAELAKAIAEREEDFDDYTIQQEIVRKVADWNAIDQKYRKAVSFVISEELMQGIYQENGNGKIVFQPNKNVTWKELLIVMGAFTNEYDIDNDSNDDNDYSIVKNKATYKGTVRLIETIDNKTWITVKTANGLYSGYFPQGEKPAGLKEGIKITIKVNKLSDKILENSLTEETETKTRNLLTANQSNVEKDLKGFSSQGFNISNGAKLQRNLEKDWQGEASLQVTTNGEYNWQGVNVNYDGEDISGAHTFSFYVKASKGTPLRIVVYDNDNSTYPTGGVVQFTASGEWERKAVPFTPTKATDQLSLQVTMNNSAQKVNYYLDGLQLEKGSVVTAWQAGQ